MSDKLLYIHRVATALDCSRPMIYKLIYDGKLKAVRIGRRGIRIPQSSLDKFIKENTIIPKKELESFPGYDDAKEPPCTE